MITKEFLINEYSKIKKSGIDNKNLYVKDSGLNCHNKEKNLGVFTKKDIEENEIIEYCHVIQLYKRSKKIDDASLKQYSFWTNCKCEVCEKEGNQGFVALGYGSIINCPDKKEQSNARFILVPNNYFIAFYATKKINKDEEILCWFGKDYYNSWCVPK